MLVDWVLMDGCIFCMSSASVIDCLLLFDSLNIIFLLLTKSSLVRGI